jgi:hypothetical protein
MLAILACGSPVPSAPQTESTATQDIPTETGFAETASPTLEQFTPTTTVAQEETAIPSPAQSCSVLQDLNLRYGPGTAYNPRIRVLPVNSSVTPLGYAPNGIPGGSWAYVQDSASLDKGWVNAGPQYISCNMEVASLPLEPFGTPLPPSLPDTSQASPGPGTCGQGGVVSENGIDVYDCAVDFSSNSLLQFKIIKNGEEIGKAGGVQNVNFSVTQNGNTVYNHTEGNAPYCIFGGDSICNSWALEDYIYKWEAGGSVVEQKKYTVSITPTLDDLSVNLFWSADITLTLP